MSDLLCFTAFERLYGIPLDYVIETFEEQKVTSVPCLHHAFAGLCSHNGTIYPVISFSHLCEREIPLTRKCMILIELGQDHFILQMNDVPTVIYDEEISVKTKYQKNDRLLKVDELCQSKYGIIYVVDLKNIIHDLSRKLVKNVDESRKNKVI